MVSDRRTLGERLKRQRERRGVTLESISQATKVPVTLFAGLERGDCSRWPAGIYSRAYVRSYASAIGLNEEETVEDFLAAFGSAVQADGIDGSPAPGSRAEGTLRLGLVEEPALTPERVAKRAALAGTDLAVASGLAWSAYALLDTTLLITVGSVLAYQTVSRLVSDEPLLWWLIRRARNASLRSAPVVESDEVAVGDAASTTA
ncbi:MAG: helix-turn-helix domain-containing protein [Vicinamibacterales bacterium]